MQNKINIQGFFAAISIPVLSESAYIFDFNMQRSYKEVARCKLQVTSHKA
jgi:hypothetical protein